MTPPNPTIITDTREQIPFEFPDDQCLTQRAALPAGDYSLLGMESRVAVERKELNDYVQSVIHQRDRFHRELVRLETYDTAIIVVEGSLADIVGRRYRSGAHPMSILGATVSIMVDHQIPVIFCDNRQIACRFTQDFLLRWYKRYGEEGADDE
jgi:DNA excision repair protein ERCC-4